MAEYRVTWEIDVDATCPADAAEKARIIQLKENSSATVYDVCPSDELRSAEGPKSEPVRIDLQETFCWSSSCGRVELFFTEGQAQSVQTPGRDATPEVTALVVTMRGQLEELDPALVREALDEYGAWDTRELSDREENFKRLVWLAGNDVAEDPEMYRIAMGC